ncbi:MAG: hypothetical protein ACTSQ1_08295 [Promethearchaeota archaeon]
MLALAFSVLPAIRKILGKSKETKALNALIKKRLSLLTYISMAGLIITGMFMARQAASSGLYTGFLSFGTEYSTLLSIKHILYIVMISVMISLSIFRSQIVDRVKKFAPEQKQKMNMPQKMNMQQKLNMLTLILNILAGLAVLFLSAYTSVLASLPTP